MSDSQRAENPIKCIGGSAVSSEPSHGTSETYTASGMVQEQQDGITVLTVTTILYLTVQGKCS